MADRDYFSKKYGKADEGYTYEEALEKKRKIDDSYGVGRSTSKWKPAIIEQDQNKRTGYRLVIERV